LITCQATGLQNGISERIKKSRDEELERNLLVGKNKDLGKFMPDADQEMVWKQTEKNYENAGQSHKDG
jgi:hypothetical protein